MFLQLVEDNKDEVARARYTSVLLSIPPEPKADEGSGSGGAPSEADPKDRNASGLTRQNQSARLDLLSYVQNLFEDLYRFFMLYAHAYHNFLFRLSMRIFVSTCILRIFAILPPVQVDAG